jgi:hypothetical protein
MIRLRSGALRGTISCYYGRNVDHQETAFPQVIKISCRFCIRRGFFGSFQQRKRKKNGKKKHQFLTI